MCACMYLCVVLLCLVLNCWWVAAFSNYPSVHGLPPPPFSHPHSLEYQSRIGNQGTNLPCVLVLEGTRLGDLGTLVGG